MFDLLARLAVTTVLSMTIFSDIPQLREKYWKRLGLQELYQPTSTATIPASYELLCTLTEAHVKEIPFENLSQHMLQRRDLPTLDLPKIAHKVLERRRGGFCLELNGLFAEFLIDLGYDVILVPAIVGRPPLLFDHPPTHVILIVTVPSSKERYSVDVGFGEPPLHPLPCGDEDLEHGKIQTTPEGMVSRLVRRNGQNQDIVKDGDSVQLEWLKDGGIWTPRLQWKYDDMVPSVSESKRKLSDFQPALDLVLQEGSNFSRKIIVCRLTQDCKTTLAGNLLKVTGPPRFPIQEQNSKKDTITTPPVTTTSLDSLERVRQVLLEEFNIPLEETEELDITQSMAQDPTLWSQM